MQPTIVKTARPQDFLALVPQLLGFLPEQSMVLVAFRGNRTCGALRFNMPVDTAPEKVHKCIATTLIGTICKIPRVDGVVVVAYTGDPFVSPGGLPGRRFAETLARRAELSGFRVKDVLCVAADGWGSYDDPECPSQGRPLAEIETSAALLLPQCDTSTELATLRDGAELPRVERAAKEQFGRALRRYQRLAWEPGADQGLLDATGVLDSIDIAEALFGWDSAELDPDEAAGLLFLVQEPPIRDQIMLQIAFGREVGEETYDVNVRYAAIQRATGLSMDEIVIAEELRLRSSEQESPKGIGGVRMADRMVGWSNERPDPERIQHAIDVLKKIIALSPRAARPAPLCMLAWLSWALGRGSVGGMFVDKALAEDPTYSMAILLNTMFSTGHLPDWAYAVPTDS
ncbi:DUF4192 domain-containing protein [Glaciibacter superstes]|uniref:DUF4192 domain-containing protein n=1 Tax=Glaciibacter superstes TaxID=501023 RepID=UPI0003B5CE31|nr:DUF4192 domain-containing protein [Glaciibacter superstes]